MSWPLTERPHGRGSRTPALIRVGNHYAEVAPRVPPRSQRGSCPVCGKPTSQQGRACNLHGQERRRRRERFARYRDEAETEEERAFWTRALEKNG